MSGLPGLALNPVHLTKHSRIPSKVRSHFENSGNRRGLPGLHADIRGLRSFSVVSQHEREEKERKLAFKESIRRVSAEASVDGWDGPGSRAVRNSAIAGAFAFYRHLPHSLSLPDVSATPTGELALEWIVAPDCQMTVLLTGSMAGSLVSLINGISSLLRFSLSEIALPVVVLDVIGAWQRVAAG